MNNVPKWLPNFLIVVVVTVWAGSYVVTWYDHTYNPPTALTTVLMAVAGFVFSGKFILTGMQIPKAAVPKQQEQDDPRPPQQP